MLVKGRASDRSSEVLFVVGDARTTALDDEQFDAVVGVDILHHLDDPVLALREWRRVTRVGGLLAVLETNPWNPANLTVLPDRHEWRVFRNTRSQLIKWTRQAGWDTIHVRPTACFTPSGPPRWGNLLDSLDRLAFRVPGAKWMSALWLLTAERR
jgi:ubiquinone/menaquinone biosynthesis C-methylase UbiE